ncbi:hypothetical protein GGTG_12057 [Gaeumannomyces tritici R3-111a-1]|uniref:NAD-dependent epimerase/dehydratase domain-containing protein n=1 Tax=Gaeumannomyces tritici (strain R3-111a-1) TaxID=644352 RepID=J3PEX8_GAET3|nr:hypothetical protein GGTG_12057 [Gaeumannomyces tritici R3-111a-1]EJT71036.1 hypothetical protein GGTG_12057 [Gaeumannomyces tritici R3-111a-1]
MPPLGASHCDSSKLDASANAASIKGNAPPSRLQQHHVPGQTTYLDMRHHTSPDVLVTGSSGHLGRALMLSLHSHGHTPLGADVLPSETTHRQGSIADRSFVESLFRENPGLRHVIHAATLHKPHVGSHSKADFVDVNITGTLNLLEAAAATRDAQGRDGIKSFVFVSTTSAFGHALSGRAGRAAWIDEDVAPVPKNIYGATKTAAEDLCRLVHAQAGMPTVVLRTARFFPEEDDDDARRAAAPQDGNLKVLELAHRRVDIADVVGACVCAMRTASGGGGDGPFWGRYVVSAPTPFGRQDETLRRLGGGEAAAVYKECVPGIEAAFARAGWEFLPTVDRVYDASRAMRDLGWRPEYTIERAVEKVARGEEWRSELTLLVGKLGYHETAQGVYTTRG